MESAVSVESRMESLKGRHATLEAKIADEDLRPRPDTAAISRLKREKLRLKEELDRLRPAQVTRTDAGARS